MYRGRWQLGGTVPLFVACKNASGTPTLPDDTPQLTVWNGATKVLVADMPVLDRFTQTGLFHYPLFLDEQFSAGNYDVVYSYLVSSFHGLETDTFEVVPGGHYDGHVTSMYFYDRPHAKFLLHSTESGKIRQGRNPYL